MRKRSGFLLVTTLLVSVVLFILGIAFLTFMSNDYSLAAQQNSSQAAFYLARGGIDYYTTLGLPTPDLFGNYFICVPLGDKHHRCQIKPNVPKPGDVTFVGGLWNDLGRPQIVRTLVAPAGNPSKWYEAVR